MKKRWIEKYKSFLFFIGGIILGSIILLAFHIKEIYADAFNSMVVLTPVLTSKGLTDSELSLLTSQLYIEFGHLRSLSKFVQSDTEKKIISDRSCVFLSHRSEEGLKMNAEVSDVFVELEEQIKQWCESSK